MNPASRNWALVFVFLVTSLPAAEQDPRMVPPPNAITGKLPGIPPTPARDAAKTFRVLDGFRMDLLASEPLLASPVASTYDEDGRACVCERLESAIAVEQMADLLAFLLLPP